MRPELLPTLLLLGRVLWWLWKRRPRSAPARTTDLRAVYYDERLTPEEEVILRANRPRLRDIAGWDPETKARMFATIRQAEGEPSFLDLAEAAVQDR